jgi:hypothetical protein
MAAEDDVTTGDVIRTKMMSLPVTSLEGDDVTTGDVIRILKSRFSAQLRQR